MCNQTIALFDTSSQITFISYEFYAKSGLPKLCSDNIALSGIIGEVICPLGYFNSELNIDDWNYVTSTNIYVLRGLCNDLVNGISCN